MTPSMQAELLRQLIRAGGPSTRPEYEGWRDALAAGAAALDKTSALEGLLSLYVEAHRDGRVVSRDVEQLAIAAIGFELSEPRPPQLSDDRNTMIRTLERIMNKGTTTFGPDFEREEQWALAAGIRALKTGVPIPLPSQS